ncbi:hypothetical protein Mal64_04680 [Pseudobythopirellula maris]|uniref:Peptidase C39 domain-containing protein n=1 Tax=Pseudobythopirellula maris TaxID=2527991 RepID=A0A5C5ZSP8_9BACT|nr:hypothetical protein [Pseudobythopirellula maris]TWT90085.1 hypothetical protein Mal64_04680 [Pseudobythopirellula maris]
MKTFSRTIPNQRSRSLSIHRDQRTCGAHALARVYASLGLRADAPAIWRRLAEPDSAGEPRIRTHRLADDALSHGLSAVCLQADRKAPPALNALHAMGWRVVLNHLITPGRPEGHFSAVVRARRDSVTLFDPNHGPNDGPNDGPNHGPSGGSFVRMRRQRLHERWMPSAPSAEVIGGVLVAVRDATSDPSEWRACPACGGDFLLPASIGTSWSGPWSAHWLAAFCPRCDARVEPLSHKPFLPGAAV